MKLLLLSCALTAGMATSGCTSKSKEGMVERGPYLVGSTNMEIAPEYADIGDDAMHDYLLGRPADSGEPRYLADILNYPESAWITSVNVPNDPGMYGPAGGRVMDVVYYVVFPQSGEEKKEPYAFPYQDALYGSFENMLAPGEKPSIADGQDRYPLIILAHGSSAHGMFDVRHAHNLASQGYIVAGINYGDDRTTLQNSFNHNHHVSYLRPLLTKAVLDSLLESEQFGDRIDTENIGISGHSFGGFTALAVMGGKFQGNMASVSDSRIKAGVLSAPWVGGEYNGNNFFPFGDDNAGLDKVDAPLIWFFGTRDDVTRASFILPASRQTSGPTYVVEMIGQEHNFEDDSWQDRDNWESLFFSAYLKNDQASLEALKTTRSMEGGNNDEQLFEYQR
jgi:dienelactone hydrolase